MSIEPSTEPSEGQSIEERVKRVLTQIRPAIQSDGGDIELVDVDADGVVRVRLHGACVGCPASSITLTMGVERNLKEQVPEVTKVICV